MKNIDKESKFAALRPKAERFLKTGSEKPDLPLSESDMLKLIHKLIK